MIAYYEPEIIPGLPPAQDTWAQKFIVFHKMHPEVFDAFQSEALSRQSAKTLHMRQIAESLRSHIFIVYGVRVNNNFLPYYVDLLDENPRLAGKFHRRARAKGKMKRVYCK